MNRQYISLRRRNFISKDLRSPKYRTRACVWSIVKMHLKVDARKESMVRFTASSTVKRPDMETTINIKELDRNIVEFILNRRVFDPTGKIIQENETKLYPSMAEFRELLDPINNALEEYDDKIKL